MGDDQDRLAAIEARLDKIEDKLWPGGELKAWRKKDPIPDGWEEAIGLSPHDGDLMVIRHVRRRSS